MLHLSPKNRWLGHLGLVLAAFLVAAAIRVPYLMYPTTDSDVAVVGLMGMHVMEGEFSPLYWGQDYGGAQEAWLAGLLFKLFGVSRTTLNASAAVFSLFQLLAVYLLGRELRGRRAGLLALWLAALGPFLFTWYSTQARGINIEVLTFGTWALWAAVKALQAPPGTARQTGWCLLTGFVLGLGLWAHMLIVYFVAPIGLFLWRRDPKLPLRPAFWLMLLAFLGGSGPLWWYNLTNHWGTYHYFFHPKNATGFRESLDWLFYESLPVLAGVLKPRGEGQVMPILSPVVAGITVLALLWSLYDWGRGLVLRLATGGRGELTGLMLATLLSVSLVFCLLGGAASHSHRYLLSVYAVWPLIPALAADRLLARQSHLCHYLAWAGLGLVGLIYFHGSFITSPLMDEPSRNEQKALQRQAGQWRDYFQKRGIRYVFTYDYWDSVRATFDVQKQVVFVLPVRERQPAYQEELLKAPRMGILVRPHLAEGLKEALGALGARFKMEEPKGGFRAFTALEPPAGNPRLITPEGFSAQGNPNQADLAQPLDQNATTRWFTLGPQKPGQEYLLDLGREVEGVCQLLIFSAQDGDRPRRLQIMGSPDGKNWRELATLGGDPHNWIWAGDKPYPLEMAPWQEVRFAPQKLRQIKLIQTGESPRGAFWTLSELLVGVDAGNALPRPDPAAAAEWLAERLPGSHAIWCDPALNAFLPPRLRARPLPHRRFPWLREYLNPDLVLDEKRQLFAVPLGREELTRRALGQAGWHLQVIKRHGYALVIADPPGPPLSANLLSSGLTPKKAGPHLDLDLGEELTLTRLVLHGDQHSFLAPAALELWASSDGQSYQPVRFQASWPPRLYWSGLLPLALQPYPLRLDFRPVQARHLRLVKALPAQGDLPDILRLDLYAPQ